ncbi:hypothetical protein ACFFU1_10285 [Algibacter miyuki]|uniref:Uncharacterized protein n=1 Tax=Algibacter miyuki TaxID=1306933 RepID=A0ABV5H1X8_9FLAO|nr:hypothetical protein [Algibacter miyuki]MDN3667568.1 hypothetical protein [Algibacter miyuki]
MAKNNKLVFLEIPDKVTKILSELEGVNLNDKKGARTRIKTPTRNFNSKLELVAGEVGIDKKMSMDIVHHSLGYIYGDKIPI